MVWPRRPHGGLAGFPYCRHGACGPVRWPDRGIRRHMRRHPSGDAGDLGFNRCQRRRCGPSGVPLCAAGTDLAASVTAHLDACMWFRAPLCLQDCNQVRRARIGKVLALAVALSAPLCMTAISDLRLLALLLSCTDLYGTRQTAATCATPGGLDLRTMECGKYLLYLIGMILLKTQCQK